MIASRGYGDSLKGERVVVLFDETKYPMNKSVVKKGSSHHKIMSNTFIGNVICVLEYSVRKRIHRL